MDYLLYIREVFINNFCVSIQSIQINKTIIKNSILFTLLRIIPFFIIKFLFNFFNIKYVYLLDNIYFSNYSNNFSIKPMFLSFELLSSNEVTSIKDIMRKYNLTIPLWFLLYNEKLEAYDKFRIKFLLKSTITNREGSIDDYKDKLIENLFQM